MKVFAISVDPDELKWNRGKELKNLTIAMPKAELERLTEFCRARGINRSEWGRRVLLASFESLMAEQSA